MTGSKIIASTQTIAATHAKISTCKKSCPFKNVLQADLSPRPVESTLFCETNFLFFNVTTFSFNFF